MPIQTHPSIPSPTKGGEKKITGHSLTEGHIMPGKDNLPGS